jgi:phosphoglycerate dehydrogenase-like enzyme
VRLLFGRERFTAELAWTDLAAVLPGWDIRTCPRHEVIKHAGEVDVICPFGARIDRAVLESGTFGLVHQFGVGLDEVDIARATELGVLVARVPGDAGGNADSVAEIAVLHRRGVRRQRAALGQRRDTPLGGELAGLPPGPARSAWVMRPGGPLKMPFVVFWRSPGS